jgi:hypothetical protein
MMTIHVPGMFGAARQHQCQCLAQDGRRAHSVTLTDTACAWLSDGGIFRSGVLGTRAVNSKALEFSVKGEALLLPGDQGAVGFGQVTIAGAVTEVTARHEGASFGSDVFLTIDGLLLGRAATSCRKALSELSTLWRSTACRYASAYWFSERLFDLRVARLQATTNARIGQ